ncbi:MAG: STAS domain-containing protein [Clostridia bacterium]|nr:STAS domain-containing protein [Clostridia bacterium]
MTIEKNVCENTAEIKLTGWLDTQTAPELDKEIKSLGEEITALTLDMEKLEYISSAGLRLIVAAYKKMNGALTLRNVSGEIMSVIKMTGLDKRIVIE